MHAAALIILALSNAGYWLSGIEGTITARWTLPDHMPQATLVWELDVDSVRLDSGSVAMKRGKLATHLKIKCPAVRVRTPLDFRYHLVTTDGKQLGGGAVIVNAFPTGITDGWAQRLGRTSLVVVDSPEGIPRLLNSAGIKFDRVDDPLDLQLDQSNVVLVGTDRLDDSPFPQACLMERARAGASVMIFEQPHVDRLTGFPVRTRAVPTKLNWDLSHPMLAHFSIDDVNSWLADLPRDVPAMRAPADALVITGWPTEPDKYPCDALLTSQTIGSGRIVLCQLHLGPWQTDPRAILLVGNALDYLADRPGVTRLANPRVVPIAPRNAHRWVVQTLPGDRS